MYNAKLRKRRGWLGHSNWLRANFCWVTLNCIMQCVDHGFPLLSFENCINARTEKQIRKRAELLKDKGIRPIDSGAEVEF